MKTIVIVSDLHCGAQTGLTPPNNQLEERKIDTAKKNKFSLLEREIWNWFKKTVQSIGKVDLCICNGDAIDGPGERSGGTEQLATDRNIQVRMAIECLETVKARKYLMTYGTGYHVGDKEDHEDNVAAALNAKIGAHEWVDAEGVIFDIKHHIGNSNVPHGRATAPLREGFWNTLWAADQLQPNANVLVRSHVHHFDFAGNHRRLCLTTPALQGFGTKYGSRRCSGLVEVGLLVFYCKDGAFDWKWHIADIQHHKAEAMKL